MIKIEQKVILNKKNCMLILKVIIEFNITTKYEYN